MINHLPLPYQCCDKKSCGIIYDLKITPLNYSVGIGLCYTVWHHTYSYNWSKSFPLPNW